MMTMQEVFNASVLGVIGQGGLSFRGDRLIGGGLACLYRGPNGRKCAVGWLIKDQFYRPELEALKVGDVRMEEALRLSGVDLNPNTVCLLSDLQSAHDGVADLDKFIWSARKIAAKFGLTFPSLLAVSLAPLIGSGAAAAVSWMFEALGRARRR